MIARVLYEKVYPFFDLALDWLTKRLVPFLAGKVSRWGVEKLILQVKRKKCLQRK
jgi:hypothetical protein